MLLVVLNLAIAVLADIDRSLRLSLGPPELSELQRLIFVAVRAGDPVMALIAVFEGSLNAAVTSDLRRRDHEHLPAGKGAGSRQRQVDRVSFAVDITRIPINLVEVQITRRH